MTGSVLAEQQLGGGGSRACFFCHQRSSGAWVENIALGLEDEALNGHARLLKNAREVDIPIGFIIEASDEPVQRVEAGIHEFAAAVCDVVLVVVAPPAAAAAAAVVTGSGVVQKV